MLQIRGVPEEQGWEAGWWRETIAVAPLIANIHKPHVHEPQRASETLSHVKPGDCGCGLKSSLSARLLVSSKYSAFGAKIRQCMFAVSEP